MPLQAVTLAAVLLLFLDCMPQVAVKRHVLSRSFFKNYENQLQETLEDAN
jgi:hypothetical protein